MKYKNIKDFNILISQNEISKTFYPIKENSIWNLIRKSTKRGTLFYTLQENTIHGDLIMVCEEYIKNFEDIKEEN